MRHLSPSIPSAQFLTEGWSKKTGSSNCVCGGVVLFIFRYLSFHLGESPQGVSAQKYKKFKKQFLKIFEKKFQIFIFLF